MLALSPRENEIAALVARGASNKKIALALKLGEPTVKEHLRRIFLKTNCASRTELAVQYVQGAPVKPARAKPSPTPPTGRKRKQKKL